jgi:hypothetical protein
MPGVLGVRPVLVRPDGSVLERRAALRLAGLSRASPFTREINGVVETRPEPFSRLSRAAGLQGRSEPAFPA